MSYAIIHSAIECVILGTGVTSKGLKDGRLLQNVNQNLKEILSLHRIMKIKQHSGCHAHPNDNTRMPSVKALNNAFAQNSAQP